MAQVSSKHSYLTLLINAAGLLHVPNILSPGMDVADPASQQAAMVTFDACVCRNCSVKAGKQQLAEGFCSEHIWTHPSFQGTPTQHLTMLRCFSAVHSKHSRRDDVLCRPSCHCCQREQKMVPTQGNSHHYCMHYGIVCHMLVCSVSSSGSQLQLVHPVTQRCCW